MHCAKSIGTSLKILLSDLIIIICRKKMTNLKQRHMQQVGSIKYFVLYFGSTMIKFLKLIFVILDVFRFASIILNGCQNFMLMFSFVLIFCTYF